MKEEDYGLWKNKQTYDAWVEMKLKEARRDDPAHVYYYAHRVEINTRRYNVKKCECGGIWSIGHKARHLTSLKHQSWMKENKIEQTQNKKRIPRYLKLAL